MKKIFSLFAAALMSAVMFVPTHAANLQVGDNILWTMNDPAATLGGLTTENKFRDLAYYNGSVYLMSNPLTAAENYPRIFKINAETGEYQGMVDVACIWGGDIALGSFQILDNGEIVAMSCRVDPTSGTVKFYGWAHPDSTAFLIGQTNLTVANRVEAIYYQGTLAAGTIYCAMQSSNQVAVIPVLNRALDTDNISYITLDKYSMESAPRVVSVTDTTLQICCKGKLYGWERTGNTTTIATYAELANGEATNGAKLFDYDGSHYWAALQYGNKNAATLADPQIITCTYTSMGRWSAAGKQQKVLTSDTILASTTRNTSFTSGIAVRNNEDGYSVWMCSLNQGVIAYRYVNPVDYKITVNTTAAGNFQITSANCTDVLNDGGSFKFDNATKTITLTNCHFTSDTYPLIINQSVNIVLVGENSITSTISATALKFASGDATIGGGGKLTLSCLNTGGADGIYCPGGNLTINECEIYAEGGYGIEGGSTRTLTINPGAKVTAYGPSKGSFTGWSSIVLGEGVEILSPAGAQIVGGDVKDAEGALLKSQVVIGVPAAEAIPATSVALDKDTLKMFMGVPATLKATVLPENTTDFVEWSIVAGGESFVSVVAGTITALAEGEAKVVAKAGEVADTCVVVVGPAPVEYGIQVYNPAKDGMLNVNSLNCADIFGDGTLSYDPVEKVLTLNNLVMDCGGYYGIINNDVDGLTVKLLGDNVLVGHSATALRLYTSTTITGGGKLTASSENNDGCYISSGTLTINACELVMQGKWGLEGDGNALVINEGAHITAIGTSSTGNADGSIKGYGSITLNGVQILSPAGAQIIGGTVCDASGATLTTEVVIGAAAPAEPVHALNPYAFGVSASSEGEVITINYSLNVDAAEVYAQLFDGETLVASAPLAGITKGAHTETVDVSEAGLPVGTYTGKIAVVGVAHEFTTYADSTVTFNNRYHATVDANPMSPNFGNIYGACRYSKVGIYRITPDYTYLNTEPAMLGLSSWASVQRGAVAPNGEMWFSIWGDSNSGIYRYDPSVKADSCTQFFIGTRAASGLITNNGQEVGCSTPGIAIYSAGKDSKLYLIGEDFTGGSTKGSLAIYNIGQEDGSIVTSWDKAPSAHHNTLTDKDGTNFAMAATPYGVWICQNRAAGANIAGARSLQFIGNDGVQRYLSTDAELINGSYGAGIVTNAAFDKLWMVNGNGNILQLSVAWAGEGEAMTPSLTLDATYETPFGAIAQMTFDFAGNIVAVGGTGNTPYSNNASVLRLAVFSLPATEAPVAATPVVGFEYEVVGMRGAYLVGGEGADFASLYAACDSVNKAVLAGNLIGDVDLLIAADLVEPKNIGLINNTDYTITIRPDQDADRTVLFTQPTDNDGPSGAFVIGCDMGITFTGTATKNIVIDGFADGGDTRRLTFTTTDGFGSKAGPIVFYGDVTNSVIKNCIVTNTIYHSSTSAYAITLRNEKNTDKCPVGVIIENNKIEVLVADNGQGIYLNGSQAATAKVGAPKNTVVRNNVITAATRGIFIYGANGLIVEGNTIRVRQHAGGRLSHGIMGNTQTGVITVRGNIFDEMTTVNTTTGDYGIQAITASGGASVWMIENNYFGGFNAGTACAGNPTKICGVRMGDSCVVRHNTFEMPVLSNTPSTTLLTNAPITLLYYAGTLNYVVENNIFISHETAANNSLARGTITANTKNNLYYIAAEEQGNAVVMDAGTPAATFADLPADIQAKSINAKIELEENYKLAADYVGLKTFAVPAIDGITTDIEGNVRHTPNVYVGCFEPADAPINEPSDPTNLNEVKAGMKAVKVLRNGHVFIIHDGKMFNMQGMMVK